MAGPRFTTTTVEMLAYRSALICNKPECSRLTVGPSKVKNPLMLLFGEGAHICSAKKNQARYDELMTDAQRSDISNGIWLCSNCHTLVDKNKGADFKVDTLREWKKKHEDRIYSLMMSQVSPFPFLRQFSMESHVAQEIVDFLDDRGVLFKHEVFEVDRHMFDSIIEIRALLTQSLSKVTSDSELRQHIEDIRSDFRSVLNNTGNFSSHWEGELKNLRNRVTVFLKILKQDYGAKIGKNLAGTVS